MDRNNVTKSEYILPCLRTFWKLEETVAREPEKCNGAEYVETKLWYILILKLHLLLTKWYLYLIAFTKWVTTL